MEKFVVKPVGEQEEPSTPKTEMTVVDFEDDFLYLEGDNGSSSFYWDSDWGPPPEIGEVLEFYWQET